MNKPILKLNKKIDNAVKKALSSLKAPSKLKAPPLKLGGLKAPSKAPAKKKRQKKEKIEYPVPSAKVAKDLKKQYTDANKELESAKQLCEEAMTTRSAVLKEIMESYGAGPHDWLTGEMIFTRGETYFLRVKPHGGGRKKKAE